MYLRVERYRNTPQNQRNETFIRTQKCKQFVLTHMKLTADSPDSNKQFTLTV